MNYLYGDGIRKELSWSIPMFKKKIRVLEIGCGYGNFKNNFPKHVEYWGVDYNPNTINNAKLKVDHFLFGSFDDVKDELPDNYFDCIVCNDVIEHMVNEDEFLNAIKIKMVEDGFIIGSIPNVRYITNIIRFIFFRDWRYVITGILDKTHLRFFTKKSLTETFIRNNYEIIMLKGINPYSFNFSSGFIKFFNSLPYNIIWK